ncbi:hypothetical protein JCM19239_6987 [Vibrio variabilis]|uniref:Uncharacterized protein n=1 Tax=Vibrio variabilis TaxID=990271 RepID=A0ABQ0JQA9_9VIBR|nr:hypothetical protein JCM19239_6987 [Vibrio variabilis]
MDVVVMLTNGRFGVLEDCDKLELEGELVECWLKKKKDLNWQRVKWSVFFN